MSATVRAGEAAVEARSATLKRELGLTDLVFTQILFVVGLPWVGVAAKQGPSHVVFWLMVAPVAILAMLGIRVAQASVMFTGNTRLPMVAGWDGLLPQWFTRVHPRFKTPVNSILFVGAATLALSIVGLVGVGKQEAFQLLWNASAIFYALTYVVMFAIPLAGRGAPAWVKACAVSGLLMTLLFVALSIVPIVQVESRLLFAFKLSTLIVVANIAGAAVFLARRPGRQPGRKPALP
jgi:glutamate:GABA antiporter